MNSYFMQATLNDRPVGKISVIVAQTQKIAKKIYGRESIIVFEYPTDRLFDSLISYRNAICPKPETVRKCS